VINEVIESTDRHILSLGPFAAVEGKQASQMNFKGAGASADPKKPLDQSYRLFRSGLAA